jgi:hypothetical protein
MALSPTLSRASRCTTCDGRAATVLHEVTLGDPRAGRLADAHAARIGDGAHIHADLQGDCLQIVRTQ